MSAFKRLPMDVVKYILQFVIPWAMIGVQIISNTILCIHMDVPQSSPTRMIL